MYVAHGNGRFYSASFQLSEANDDSDGVGSTGTLRKHSKESSKILTHDRRHQRGV